MEEQVIRRVVREAVAEAAEAATAPAYLDTQAAARYLGLSTASLEGWRSERRGPPFTKVGRAVRYRRTDLEEFMAGRLSPEARRVEPVSP